MNQFFFAQLFWFLTKNRHFQNAEIPIEIITENIGPHGYLPLTSISRKISNFAKRAETSSVRFPMQKNAIPRVSEFIVILPPTFLKIGQIHQHPHSYLRFTIPGAKAPYMGFKWNNIIFRDWGWNCTERRNSARSLQKRHPNPPKRRKNTKNKFSWGRSPQTPGNKGETKGGY